ncbi:MAG: DNA polymerase III subunit [Clostridia bacterium]|nr:DNA polymerase III subunit [Clostridia bacterium]
MRKFFSDILGNEKTKASIGKSIIDATLSHAYIIEGPEGSGKKMLAYRIAAALNCENKTNESHALPCMRCESCRKILSDNSPDVYHLRREEDKATINLPAIREMRSDIFLSASESEYKVYIIHEAHLLNDASQNALLKVLEEPPEKVVMLLLCNATDKILTTVKSRAQIIRTSLFTFDEMKEFLLENNNAAASLYTQSKEKFFIALKGSQGSIGKALDLINPKEMSGIIKKREIIDNIIKAIEEKSDFVAFHSAVFALSQKRLQLIDELTLLFSAIRDLILKKKSEDVALIYYYDTEEATRISEKIGINRLYELSDSVFKAISNLSQSSNVSLTLNTLLNELKK